MCVCVTDPTVSTPLPAISFLPPVPPCSCLADITDARQAGSPARGSAPAKAPDTQGRRRSKGPKRPATSRDWDWEKLVTDDVLLLDSAWCMLLDTPGLAEQVPLESRTTVLDCGYTWWTTSNTLTTTRCAVLFRRLLGVPIVRLQFLTYRDAFLFALAVHWDVDVARYDLFLSSRGRPTHRWTSWQPTSHTGVDERRHRQKRTPRSSRGPLRKTSPGPPTSKRRRQETLPRSRVSMP